MKTAKRILAQILALIMVISTLSNVYATASATESLGDGFAAEETQAAAGAESTPAEVPAEIPVPEVTQEETQAVSTIEEVPVESLNTDHPDGGSPGEAPVTESTSDQTGITESADPSVVISEEETDPASGDQLPAGEEVLPEEIVEEGENDTEEVNEIATTLVINYDAAVGGEVTTTSETIDLTSAYTIKGSKAKASDGYLFTGWEYEDGSLVSTEDQYAPAADMIDYIVYYAIPDENGVIEATFTARFEEGEEVTDYVYVGTTLIKVRYNSAAFDETVMLDAKEITKRDAEYAQVEAAVDEATGADVSPDEVEFAAFDIFFLNKDGSKVEPKTGSFVAVSISTTGSETPEPEDVEQVLHIDDSNNIEEIPADTTGGSADFVTDNFSIYVVVGGVTRTLGPVKLGAHLYRKGTEAGKQTYTINGESYFKANHETTPVLFTTESLGGIATAELDNVEYDAVYYRDASGIFHKVNSFVVEDVRNSRDDQISHSKRVKVSANVQGYAEKVPYYWNITNAERKDETPNYFWLMKGAFDELHGVISAKVYLRYSNQVPANIHHPYGNAQYGPDGDNQPYFIVRVDLDKLQELGAKRATDVGSHVYFTHQSSGIADAYTFFYDYLIPSMPDAADRQKFADSFSENNFVGYILKNEHNEDYNNWHIDGILLKDPTYLVELYEKDNANAATGSRVGTFANDRRDPYSRAMGAADGFEKYFRTLYGSGMEATWTSLRSGFVKDGSGNLHYFTIKERNDGSGIDGNTPDSLIKYRTVTPNHYFVARFDIWWEDTGVLNIRKNIDGNGAVDADAYNKTYTFHIKQGNTRIAVKHEGNGDWTYDPNGTNYDITITGQGYARVAGLIANKQYTVEEVKPADGDSYTVSVSGSPVTVLANKNSTVNVDIKNTFTKKTGRLRFEKVFTGSAAEQGWNGTRAALRFTIRDNSGAVVNFGTVRTWGSFEFAESFQYNWLHGMNSPRGGYVVFDNVPEGTYYVEETGAELGGYKLTTTGTGVRVEVKAGQQATLRVENSYEREITNVTVIKKWEGKSGSATFTLKANGGQAKDVNGNNVASVTLSGDNTRHTFDNLPKVDSNNREINYTVEEAVINGYRSSVSQNGSTWTFTNTEETSVTVKKVWNDASNQDGVRPASVRLGIFKSAADADQTPVQEITVRGNMNENEWEHTFSNLVTTENNRTINYAVKEWSAKEGKWITNGNLDDNYKASAQGLTITNTHEPAKKQVKVVKEWSDANNQDGKRPESVTVYLKANGAFVNENNATVANKNNARKLTLNEAGNWEGSFTNLPAKANGADIAYTVEEDVPAGYTEEYEITTNGNTTNIKIKNTYKPEQKNISVTKAWADDNDRDGKRPQTVQVKLTATVGGAEIVPEGLTEEDMTANLVDGAWTKTWRNLPVKKDGKDIVYSVDEVKVPEGYTKTVEGNGTTFTITNTHVTEKVSFRGIKYWDDNDNQDGVRPNRAYLALFRVDDGVKTRVSAVRTVNGNAGTVNGNNWTWRFPNWDKYENGKEITYVVREVDSAGNELNVNDSVNADYFVSAYGEEAPTAEDRQNGVVKVFTVTNKHNITKTSIEAVKRWDDEENRDGKRPEVVTIGLFKGKASEPVAEKQATAGTNWKVTFEDLDVKENGRDIVYTVKERNQAGNTWVNVNGQFNDKYKLTAVNGNAETGFTLVNTAEPEMTEVKVVKKWKDTNNKAGLRPKTVVMELYADGNPTGETKELSGNTKTDEGWSATFTGLNKYAQGKVGVEIQYSAKERALPAGYRASAAEAVKQGDSWVVTVENTYDPEYTVTSVRKVWVDNENSDGTRPAYIHVYLKANGSYTDDAFNPVASINDAVYVILNEKNNWFHAWNKLPKYLDGEAVSYTVEEHEVPDVYISETSGSQNEGYVITNRYEPKETSFTVLKSWNDNEDQDGFRPDDVTVYLLADGSYVNAEYEKTSYIGNAVSVKLNGNNGWTYKWDALPMYENGHVIRYTAIEDPVPAQYTVSYSGTGTDADPYVITNTHGIIKTSVSVKKVWEDNNNQDGYRPESVIFHLLADGEKVDEVSLSDANAWKHTFTDLDVKANGKDIVYTVSEPEVPAHYTAGAVTGKGTEADPYVITNTHEKELVNIEVIKHWDDADNQDGDRPDGIMVTLKANGSDVETVRLTGEKRSDEGWTKTWTKLDKKANGEDIRYEIVEADIPGYDKTKNDKTTSGTGTDEDPYRVVFTLENKDTPGKTTVTVKKVWNDADDQDGMRPESVTVQLYADKKAVTDYTYKDENGADVTVQGEQILNEENNWEFTWKGLDEKKDGELVDYSVDETEVPEGYKKNTEKKNGIWEVTNTHTPEETDIKVKKIWSDANNAKKMRPSQVNVQLFKQIGKEGTPEAVTGMTLTLKGDMTSNEGWEDTFKEVPVYENGEKLIYTFKEFAAGSDGVPTHNTVEDGGMFMQLGMKGDTPLGYKATYDYEANPMTVTNTYRNDPEDVKEVKDNSEDLQDAIDKAYLKALSEEFTFTIKTEVPVKEGLATFEIEDYLDPVLQAKSVTATVGEQMVNATLKKALNANNETCDYVYVNLNAFVAPEHQGKAVVVTIKANIDPDADISAFLVTGIENTADIIVDGDHDPTNIVKVIPPESEQPGLKKTVNGAEHINLGSQDESFTYELVTNIPENKSDLTSFVITDTLKDVLDFDGARTVTITKKEAGATPEPVSGADSIGSDGKMLVVSIPQQYLKHAYYGAEVKVTFGAKISDNATDAQLNAYKETSGNKIPNQASYDINNGFWTLDSNIVTVTPPDPEMPPITKVVDGSTHKNLDKWSDPFTYTISTEIPKRAGLNSFVVTDTLVKELEFASDIKVEIEGEPMAMMISKPEKTQKELVVNLDAYTAKEKQGSKVTITFKAKIAGGLQEEDLVKAYPDRRIPNGASYDINNDPKLHRDSDVVTVTPPKPDEPPVDKTVRKKLGQIESKDLKLDTWNETVTYTIRTKIPVRADLDKFSIYDTMANVMRFDSTEEEVVVLIENEDGDMVNAAKAVVSFDDTKLTVNMDAYAALDLDGAYQGRNVEVRYDARVREDVTVEEMAPYKTGTIDNRATYQINNDPEHEPDIAKITIPDDKNPPISKTVDGGAHKNLNKWSDPFEYVIRTKIPVRADLAAFEITDTLEDVLEFVSDEISVKIGTDNEIKVNKPSGQTLAVTFDKDNNRQFLQEAFQGKDVVITFTAKIKDGADVSGYADKKIPNFASYTINGNPGEKSEVVTVTPPDPTTPPIKKDVNGKEHVTLKTPDETFTYTIQTGVPLRSNLASFVITDAVKPELEITSAVTVMLGEGREAKDISAEFADAVNGQTVTVDMKNYIAAEYQGMAVKVSFEAKVRKGADVSVYEDGEVPNTATYKINNDPGESNTVYVKPKDELIDIPVKKFWDDANDYDGVRPDYVTVTLYANGEEVDRRDLVERRNWEHTFKNLKKYEGGKQVVYTVEEKVPEGYTVYVSYPEADAEGVIDYTEGIEVHNEHNPEIDKKVNNADHVDLLKRDQEFIYTISTAVPNGKNVKTFEIIDELKPVLEVVGDIKVSVAGAQVAVDANNVVTVAFTGAALEAAKGAAVEVSITARVKEGADLTPYLVARGIPNDAYYEIDDKPSDRTIPVTVQMPVPEIEKFVNAKVHEDLKTREEVFEYLIRTQIPERGDMDYFIIEDTLVPELKMAIDRNDQVYVTVDGNKVKATVNLLTDKDGERIVEVDIPKANLENDKGKFVEVSFDAQIKANADLSKYTVRPYSTDGRAMVPNTAYFTLGLKPEVKSGTRRVPQAGENKIVKESNVVTVTPPDPTIEKTVNGGTHAELNKFDDDINYVITTQIPDRNVRSFTVKDTLEEALTFKGTQSDVEVTIGGNVIPNAARISGQTLEVTITGSNLEKLQGQQVVVKFTARVKEGANLTPYKENNDIRIPNKASYRFDNAPEVSSEPVTVTPKPEYMDLPVEKIWDDADDQDGARPERDGITFRLLQNGTEIDSVTVSARENWTHTFRDLLKYEENGTPVQYNVTEDSITNYTAQVEEVRDANGILTGVIVTNTHTPDERGITVVKGWNDQANRYGTRPETVTVQLLADGTVIETEVLGRANNWRHTWTGLPVNRAGNEIAYTVQEVNVPNGYAVEITGDMERGFVINNTLESGELRVVKQVEGLPAGITRTYSFTITHAASGTVAARVSITGSGSQTLTVPAGNYVVTETNAGVSNVADYTMVTTGSGELVTVPANGSATATIVNTYTEVPETPPPYIPPYTPPVNPPVNPPVAPPVAPGGAVLGVRRTGDPDEAVLGARRGITGDKSTEKRTLMMMLSSAMALLATLASKKRRRDEA